MKDLLSTNCFDFEESIVLLGSCLVGREKILEEVKKFSSNIYTVCLESTHFNMVVTKVLDVIAREKTKKIAIVTVDKSPHCVQLHYQTKEIENIKDKTKVEIKNYVVEKEHLVEIPVEVLSLSKNLSKLKKVMEGEN